MNTEVDAFFELLRAGLWEQEVHLSQFGVIDYKKVSVYAEEQAVVGFVAAGLEHVQNVKVPQEVVLNFVSSALQLEQRNASMNKFIADLISKIRGADIYTLLVKGQGVGKHSIAF